MEFGTWTSTANLHHSMLPKPATTAVKWSFGFRKRADFPLLSPLAQDLLSAPALQAYVERAFSVCGDLTMGKRNRLTKSLEMRTFLKMNSKYYAWLLLTVFIADCKRSTCISNYILLIDWYLVRSNTGKLPKYGVQQKMYSQFSSFWQVQNNCNCNWKKLTEIETEINNCNCNYNWKTGTEITLAYTVFY